MWSGSVRQQTVKDVQVYMLAPSHHFFHADWKNSEIVNVVWSFWSYHILSSAHQYVAYTATIDQVGVCNVTAVAHYGRSTDQPTLVIISSEPLIVFQLCLDCSSHSFRLAVQSRVSKCFSCFNSPVAGFTFMTWPIICEVKGDGGGVKGGEVAKPVIAVPDCVSF